MKTTVVIPLKNNRTTIIPTLKSLYKQAPHFSQLIIIDDHSTDGSLDLVDKFLSARKYQPVPTIIKHSQSQGLAASYNEGITKSAGDIIVTLHSDILLKPNALKLLTKPFSDTAVVAATHRVIHPYKIWNKYNFWQKVFFSRLLGKTFSGLDGKFDAFSRQALITVGLFDHKTFTRAGEDGDIVHRLSQIGKIAQTQATIIHIHSLNPGFSINDIIYKQKQYSEAQGVLLRLGRTANPASFARAFFREILLLSLLVPYLRYLSAPLTLAYACLYTFPVFRHCWRDPRVVILPLLNLYLLPVSLAYSIRGFVRKKQVT